MEGFSWHPKQHFTSALHKSGYIKTSHLAHCFSIFRRSEPLLWSSRFPQMLLDTRHVKAHFTKSRLPRLGRYIQSLTFSFLALHSLRNRGHVSAEWLTALFLHEGYYTQISTLADVQENVMEYLHVLSRPMVINHDHDIIWTEAYMDSAVRTPARAKPQIKPWKLGRTSQELVGW